MKKMVCLICAIIFVVGLSACSVEKEDIVGTWKYSWYYDGNDYSKYITLRADNTYACVTYKNGYKYETTSGDYEIDGSKICLYDSDSLVYHGSATIYEYKNGKIYGGGGDSEYIKQ